MDRPLEVLTYSSGSTLFLCEQKYRLRYERRLKPRCDDDEKLVVGNWSHAGLEAYVTSGTDAALATVTRLEDETPEIGPDVLKLQQRAAKVRAMIRVAAEKWPVGQGQKIAEQAVEMMVINPETGAPSRTFVYRGVVDGVDGKTLVDWKTVADVTDFIEKKQIGYQTELYAAALAYAGISITSAVFRLITVPTIKLCNKDGGNPRVYEDRCVEWLKSDPTLLVEHEMFVDAGRIERAKHWLWTASKRILENRRTGRWPTNEHACQTWSRRCEYMDICLAEARGNDAQWIMDQGFDVVDDPHPELARATCKEVTPAHMRSG
jgi:hypothetical protein